MAKLEITRDELLQSSDWAEVFGEGSGGNTDGQVDAAPAGEKVSTDPVLRTDVKTIVAAVNGENDGPDWVGVFRLKDGRYLVASGCCDYTGWDCQASNNLTVFASLQDAVEYGLTPENKARLEL